ncbi:Uncharacterised protein [Nocardia cyriacigeorgica]|uniref:Uncharacterized protein n=1 Tax=Nocardia cyriacigeorgica TaxID=135487 RepID=A0A4U8WB19_9NOCA|nr:Uncharacterised protein [Nocardia cyriacigeorgica]
MWYGHQPTITSGRQHCDLITQWGFRRAVRVQGVDGLDSHGLRMLEAVVVRMVRRWSDFDEGARNK